MIRTSFIDIPDKDIETSSPSHQYGKDTETSSPSHQYGKIRNILYA